MFFGFCVCTPNTKNKIKSSLRNVCDRVTPFKQRINAPTIVITLSISLGLPFTRVIAFHLKTEVDAYVGGGVRLLGWGAQRFKHVIYAPKLVGTF
jgi:hypothetical protein